MEKLYEQQEQQRRENVMLREQLEKTVGQYHENLNSVEQERDALKQRGRRMGEKESYNR